MKHLDLFPIAILRSFGLVGLLRTPHESLGIVLAAALAFE
jgi:hypothetical protein